ncbi:MAG: tyrosine-type recombinase/integrase [Candidatus Nealsonbacteria bacterium]
MLDYFEDFLLHIKTNNYSEETLYNYERDLKTFEDFLEKESKISFERINKKTIEQYKAYLVSRDRKTALGHQPLKRLSSGSINRTLSSLRRYLKYLIKMDYKTPVAPETIELLRTEKKLPRIVEFEELIKLIESPSQFEKNKVVALRNRAILETLFATGVRISELINIKKSDIEKTGRIFVKGKGKKERFVYLTPRAQKHIKMYSEVRAEADSPYLFVPYRGKNVHQKDKKLSPNYLEDKVKKYRELLGLSIPITVHGIRRCFATYLAEKGASVAAIQILLGHESLDTTTRYVRVSNRYVENVHHKYHPLKD